MKNAIQRCDRCRAHIPRQGRVRIYISHEREGRYQSRWKNVDSRYYCQECAKMLETALDAFDGKPKGDEDESEGC
ncbi:MAG: hypothetical protein IJ586_08550 [Alloprevotella sp.]|nr:hypothetical protein [Alloprevotella sp.]MBR1447111.1 hypothetical protein [Alloprevotella sp.]